MQKAFKRLTIKPTEKDLDHLEGKLECKFFPQIFGGSVSDTILNRLFVAFNVSNNELLSYREFICGMAVFLHGKKEEKEKCLQSSITLLYKKLIQKNRR